MWNHRCRLVHFGYWHNEYGVRLTSDRSSFPGLGSGLSLPMRVNCQVLRAKLPLKFFFHAVCFWFLFPEVFKKAARLLVTISRCGPFEQKVWFNRKTVIYYSGAAAAPVRPGPDQAPQSCPQDLTLFPFPPLCLNPQYKSQCFGSPSGAYYCLWGIKDH